MTLAANTMAKPTRRAFLAGASGCALALGCASVRGEQQPFHTVRVGELEVTVVSDGNLLVPTPLLATNVQETTLRAALGTAANRVEPPCNVTLVRTAKDFILIDTGSGPHFMPTAGRLLANLERAGIKPEQITKVVFTHGHPDHLWGTLDEFDDSLNFPNAEHIIPAAEWNFWSNEGAEALLPDDRKTFARPAAKILSKIKHQARTVTPGDDVAHGLRCIDMAGHTAGQVAIELASGTDSLLVVADTLTHTLVSFAHPDWTPAADHHDREQAVRMRLRLLDRLATDRARFVGFHLPFPGIGRVTRTGTAYRYEADAA